MADYATVFDVVNLKRELTLTEQNRAEKLIPIICSLIRYEAKKTGRDYDQMIYQSDLAPIIDCFTATSGVVAEFTLSNDPQGEVIVTINGVEVPSTDYAVSGRTLTFNEPRVGEILVTYSYRVLADIAKGVVCDIVIRELNTPGDMLPATSYSEGAGGVSQSYSLPNASGAIKLWPSDLKTLGLRRQKIDVVNLVPPRPLPPPPPRRW